MLRGARQRLGAGPGLDRWSCCFVGSRICQDRSSVGSAYRAFHSHAEETARRAKGYPKRGVSGVSDVSQSMAKAARTYLPITPMHAMAGEAITATTGWCPGWMKLNRKSRIDPPIGLGPETVPSSYYASLTPRFDLLTDLLPLMLKIS